MEKGNNIKEKRKIVGECERPRSYAVQLESGSVVERNRKHLLKFEPKTESKDSEPKHDFTCKIEPSNEPMGNANSTKEN